MSKKPYKSEEMQEHEKKIKKQNKILFILLILFFIPPLCLFPAYPKTYWQYNIYEYITKNMLITVGTKGPLPFFTILSSIYLTAFSFLLGCYICLIYIRKYGLKKEFQQKFYSLFFQAEFSSSYKYPWLEKPFIKKSLVSIIFFLCFLMGIWHFFQDEISFQDGSRRGALIKLGYNYRLGVLFWESIISLFNVFPIFYLIFFTLYLINYFIFGLSSGKIILPQTKSKRKKRKK